MCDTEEQRPINSESREGVNDLFVAPVEGGRTDNREVVCEPFCDKGLNQNGSEPRESGANNGGGEEGICANIDGGQEGSSVTADKSNEIRDSSGSEYKEDGDKGEEEEANEDVIQREVEDDEGLAEGGLNGNEAVETNTGCGNDGGGAPVVEEEDIALLGPRLSTQKEDRNATDETVGLTVEERNKADEETDKLSQCENVMGEEDDGKTDVEEGCVDERNMLSEQEIQSNSPNRHQRSLALEDWWMSQIKVGAEGCELVDDAAHVRIVSAPDVGQDTEIMKRSDSNQDMTGIEETGSEDCMIVAEANENLNEICESVAAVDHIVETVVANVGIEGEENTASTVAVTSSDKTNRDELIGEVDDDFIAIEAENNSFTEVTEPGNEVQTVSEKEVVIISESDDNDSVTEITPTKSNACSIVNDAENEADEEGVETPYLEDETLCKDIDVFLYRLPVVNGERVVKASKWDISNPIMTGTLQLVRESNGRHVIFIMDDDDVLYGRAAINYYPSSVLQPTLDSTRYFIFTLTEMAGRTTRVFGIGFYDSSKLLEILKAALVPEFGYGDCGPQPKRRKIELTKQSGFFMEPTTPLVTQKLHQPKLSEPGGTKLTMKAAADEAASYSGIPVINPATNEYPCQFCLETYDTEKDLKTHWEDKHGLRHPASCVVCKLPFPSERSMLNHRSKSHGFSCHICKNEFTEAKAAVDHLREVHSNA